MSKIVAVLEVLMVRGVILAIGVWLASTTLTFWQMDHLPHVFNSHTLFILVPVIWLAITRREFTKYGITFRHLKEDFQTAMSAFLPVSLGGAALVFFAHTQWHGALIIALVQIGVLYFVALSLINKPDPKSGYLTVLLSLIIYWAYGALTASLPTVPNSLVRFVFYLVFVGFGEEILYRGYILTRLNQAFGCPYQFYGVSWGWGAILSAGLFGLSHVLNGWNILTGEFSPMWWWGFWTFFSAFVFTFIREKSGSIIPAAIVHGLPQALLALFISTI